MFLLGSPTEDRIRRVLIVSAGMVPTRRDEAALRLHATRDMPRTHYSRAGFAGFTFSGPHTSTPWNREGNRISAIDSCAQSIRYFGYCFLTK